LALKGCPARNLFDVISKLYILDSGKWFIFLNQASQDPHRGWTWPKSTTATAGNGENFVRNLRPGDLKINSGAKNEMQKNHVQNPHSVSVLIFAKNFVNEL
jgi:hypothetical protein